MIHSITMIDRNENEDTVQQRTSCKAVATLFVYCLSGTLLTLANKLAIVIFPYPHILLVLQNGVSVILLISGFKLFRCKNGPVLSMNMFILKLWIPLVLLFVGILTSSLFALLYVSVPTVIVTRNLSTLSTAVLEYVFLGTKINVLSAATLIGILLGTIFYGKHDLTFDLHGYTWLLINIVATSLYQIYVKKIVHLESMKEFSIVHKRLFEKNVAK